MKKMKEKLSIVVPAYNEEKYIRLCLQSLTKHRTSLVKEIIVVDNGSSDKTAAVARTFAGVRVVTERRKGPAFARQRGLKAATADLIAYIDADTHITSTWLRTVEREFTKRPKLIALSGPCQYFDLPVHKQKIILMYWLLLILPSHFFSKCVLIGGNFVARRDALLSIGGFDSSVPFYGDDTNIARRLSKIGNVRFNAKFKAMTSARRLEAEGMIKVAVKYMVNHLSEIVMHRPLNRRYIDIR